ncbi:MAG: HIT family protein [Candidatus Nanoarchaeia archaeon]
MKCPLCDEAKNLEVFSTETVQVLAHPKPAVEGHVLVMPKKHYPILEAVPNDVVEDMFSISNKVSIALFEGLKAQGTNVLVQNGIPAGQTEPHVAVHVVPRFENDGLNFDWKPTQKSDEELGKTEELLKGAKSLVEKSVQDKGPEKEESAEEADEDWELKSLERIP